jgi:hypothetical protein
MSQPPAEGKSLSVKKALRLRRRLRQLLEHPRPPPDGQRVLLKQFAWGGAARGKNPFRQKSLYCHHRLQGNALIIAASTTSSAGRCSHSEWSFAYSTKS